MRKNNKIRGGIQQNGIRKWDDNIDYIKAICIILIIVTHFNWNSETRECLLFPYWIDMAVPILMIVTGFNYFHSWERGFNIKKLTSYVSRLIIPYCVLVIPQVIELYIKKVSLIEIIKNTIAGGYGPGGYYVPVMIQVVLLFGLIHYIVKKYDKFSIAIILAVIFLIEGAVIYFGFSGGMYKIMSHRYFLFLVAGALYAKHEKDKVVTKGAKIASIGCMFVLGIVSVYLVKYFYDVLPFFGVWKTTSCLIILLALAWFVFFKQISLKHNALITMISKSSYHIFLIQKMWYYYTDKSKIGFFDKYAMVIPNIIICCGLGILFYMLESGIRKCIQNK